MEKVDVGGEGEDGTETPTLPNLKSTSIPSSTLPRSISAPSALSSWVEGHEGPPAVVRVQEPVAGEDWSWCVPGGLSQKKDWVIFVYERVKDGESDGKKSDGEGNGG